MSRKADNTYKCIVTGAEKYIPPSLCKKKIIKFGSVEEYRKHYISREAVKLLKQRMTVDEIRKSLNITEDLDPVPTDILIKLKLVKLNTRKGKKEADEARERARYLNSQEFKDKKRRIALERENLSYADWVEENSFGRRLLFVSMTRATKTLHVLHHRPLPSVLGKAAFDSLSSGDLPSRL